MSTPAKSFSFKWPIKQILFMATIGGYAISNGTMFASLYLSAFFVPDGEGLGYVALMLMLSGGRGPWALFLIIYLPLTIILRDKLGGWERTQLVAIGLAWLGDVVVLLIFLLTWPDSPTNDYMLRFMTMQW